jgi:Xaa-Pro aminopeptidase
LLTMHPTLLVGPYDWDPERIPKEEFTDRIQAFWDDISDTECSAAIVYGDSRHHAELMYLSHFVPKLGPAFLLVPREGGPTLLVSGAPNMLPAARRMTWIEQIQPLRDAGKDIVQWLEESYGSGAAMSQPPAALIGGEYIRSANYRSLTEAFAPENPFVDATAPLRRLMRYKRPRELILIRDGCSILKAATQALAEAKESGASLIEAILQAERVAYQMSAQDVRTLFSLDGGRTLRPFEAPIADRVDPLQAYIAVRHAGYWAEGFVLLADLPDLIMMKASAALKAVIKVATAGTSYANLARVVAEISGSYQEHPMTRGNMGNGIGLSLEEEPRLVAGSEDALDVGSVYTLRVGVSDGEGHHAIMSAMVVVNQRGNKVLWSATEATRAKQKNENRAT